MHAINCSLAAASRMQWTLYCQQTVLWFQAHSVLPSYLSLNVCSRVILILLTQDAAKGLYNKWPKYHRRLIIGNISKCNQAGVNVIRLTLRLPGRYLGGREVMRFPVRVSSSRLTYCNRPPSRSVTWRQQECILLDRIQQISKAYLLPFLNEIIINIKNKARESFMSYLCNYFRLAEKRKG